MLLFFVGTSLSSRIAIAAGGGGADGSCGSIGGDGSYSGFAGTVVVTMVETLYASIYYLSIYLYLSIISILSF